MDEKWTDVECMKNTLTTCMKSAIDGGIDKVNTREAGEIIDMIKDLAMTEKCCWEKKYYESVVKAMEEGQEEKYGYPRYSGNMRIRSGYRPFMDQEPYIDAYLNDPEFKDRMKMGYMDDQYRDNNGRYGRAYNEYRTAKRHYTDTNSMRDKEEMTIHANEHIADMITTVRDIWKEADPELRKKMKTDISNLISEMTV